MSELGFDPAGVTRLEDLPVITQGCDTIYAWHKDFQHLSIQATAAEICDTMESRCPSFHHPQSGQSVHLVITGGEPMLSQTAMTDIFETLETRNNLPSQIGRAHV